MGPNDEIFYTTIDRPAHRRYVLGRGPVRGRRDTLETPAGSGHELPRRALAGAKYARAGGARREVFESLIARGVPFTNVIDRTAILRTNVEIGTGNVILGSTYLGACTLVGDNNFISSNVCLEHGNVLGSHSAFGPGVVTSGNVSIGSGVRFGTGIFIEPLVSIGDGSVIASGSIITKDVQTGAVLKHRENVVTREI